VAKQHNSPLNPILPDRRNSTVHWGQLYGASQNLAIASAAEKFNGLTLVLVPDSQVAIQVEEALRFFSSDPALQVSTLPDWETLPYDVFSPHEDIISQRLEALHHLPHIKQGLMLVPMPTLIQRLAPRSYIQSHSILLKTGDELDIEALRHDLGANGYHFVQQVMEHGEFSIRGSIIDLFPMGSDNPFRIDLFDNEIESIRNFSPEDQRSRDTLDEIRILPAHEFPLDEEAIKGFRQRFRSQFEGDPQRSPIYNEVSNGAAPAGIEYYLPLFFEQTESLFDYLPGRTQIIEMQGAREAAHHYREAIEQRYEQLRYNIERPLLPPDQLFLSDDELSERLQTHARVELQSFEFADTALDQRNYGTSKTPSIRFHPRTEAPAQLLQDFLAGFDGRVLLTCDSTGRREHVLELLRPFDIRPDHIDRWPDFIDADTRLGITVAPLEEGFILQEPAIALLTEGQLLGERTQQTRRRRKITRDADAVVRNLTDLHPGAPVVHEDHGVGRYVGLVKLEVNGVTTEFLSIEYAGGDKLYVPVSSLHLINRYTGASPENAPLHKLGSEQWQKARRKAARKAHDVAVELLDIYARRAARKGHSFHVPRQEYASFAEAFPFEETPDQQKAIDAVLSDLESELPMDRVVCGDVGFGKTEVAMRAAAAVTLSGKQVAVLVPTTLLAQQHTLNFQDRFADWPVRIESLSRFRTGKELETVLDKLANGQVDIVIGTHKLLQKDIRFKDLGLVIIDEEHRFGVRHKERLKALRSEVDMLTLTATPIPRTLNMSLAGLRDLSIIATPPVHRHAIKTFVSEWNSDLVQEACSRELRRGGQVYFLHNEVKSIEKQARELQALLPDAKIRFAHGQMREKELEQIMVDFYHQRFNILVATTIIESGIDVPSANTILINRADKLGLAQLHQLRGRVGRSHHRAYAYLITPPKKAMTADALKRLEAIESLEDLGVGFTLASHDLEIRGAGELLGDEQSGQIQEIGFSMYNELLERAVKAIKSGQVPDADLTTAATSTEIDLGTPAMLPDDYIQDIHTRLILYKRIANAASQQELDELQIELIDRFGLLPGPAKCLFANTAIKLQAQELGIRKIEFGTTAGRIQFADTPSIDPARMIQLIQTQPQHYKLDSQQRLHLLEVPENFEERIEHLQQLLDTLRLKEAA
jgi:transcription-repair coupling factor (superfamily II helicase)